MDWLLWKRSLETIKKQVKTIEEFKLIYFSIDQHYLKQAFHEKEIY